MKDVKYRDASVLSGKYLSLGIYRLCGILFGGIAKPSDSAERHIISELKYITGIKNLAENLSPAGFEACVFGKYNFDNPYLNNIIKNASAE
jgi:hypothetical protein